MPPPQQLLGWHGHILPVAPDLQLVVHRGEVLVALPLVQASHPLQPPPQQLRCCQRVLTCNCLRSAASSAECSCCSCCLCCRSCCRARCRSASSVACPLPELCCPRSSRWAATSCWPASSPCCLASASCRWSSCTQHTEASIWEHRIPRRRAAKLASTHQQLS